MFDYFKGILTDKNFHHCTLEVQGIGYRFLVNSRTLSNLGEIGDEIKIYSKLIHKEDSMTLCGFSNKQDRVIFDILTTVSGVGVKAGFALLDEFETNELISAVIGEDAKLISRTKGIGVKIAQKIVIELKDKLTKIDTISDITSSKISNSVVSNDTINQTITILESLGYSKNEYMKPLENALNILQKDDTEFLLKEVLQMLSTF